MSGIVGFAAGFGRVRSVAVMLCAGLMFALALPLAAQALTVPPSAPAVTSLGISATSSGSVFNYAAGPAISGISPAEGAADAVAPPANVTISGSSFSASGNTVNFGGTAGTIVSESPTSIVVTPPANATGGLVSVEVVQAGGDAVTAANAYRYLLPPTVTVTWSPATVTTAQTPLFTLTVTNPNDVAIENVRVASNGATTPFSLTAFGQFCGSGNYNASSAFSLSGFPLAAGASCTASGNQRGSAGIYQFVTNAPTSTGTATTAATLTGLAATSNTITVYGTPTISNITPNSGPLAGGQSVTLTGTNFTDATAVTIDGVVATDITVVSATRITATTPAGTSGGTKSVAVTAPGGTGTRSGFYAYNALPTAPTISSPAEGGSTGASPVFSGNAGENGATITVYVDGASIGTTTTAGTAAWTLAHPGVLAGGAHTVYATSTTALRGTSAASATKNFTVDATAPAAPVVTTPTPGTNTTDTTPTFTGTAEADATITISASSVVQATTTADGSGNWTVDLPVQADAQYNYVVTATDTAGNVSPNTVVAVRIDTVAPATPTLTAPIDDGPATVSTPSFEGTGEPSTAINLKFNGDNYVSGISVDGSGAWSFTFSGSGLGSGVYVATVTNEDFAGNVSPVSNSRTFTIDRTAPVVQSSAPEFNDVAQVTTKVFLVTFNEPVGTAVSADFTVAETGTVTGTISDVAVSGNEVRVTVSGLSGEGTVRVDVPASSGITDVLGNGGGVNGFTAAYAAGSTHTVDDVTPPFATLTSPADGSTVATATPVITGASEAGSTVTIYLDNTFVAQVVANGSGVFSHQLSTQSDGSYSLNFGATDVALNSSGLSPAYGFTIDTTAPTVPVITSPATGAALSTSTALISGTAEAASTVTVTIDGTSAGTVTTDGSGGWSFTTAALADGSHTVSAFSTDGVGNASPASTTINFTVDTAAPAAPVIATPGQASLISNATPVVSGTAEAGSSVAVMIDDSVVSTITANGSGGWSFTSAALADGAHTVQAVAADTSGNVSPASTVVTFTIDATAPATPTVSAPVNGSTTAVSAPVISGTAEAYSTVTVVIDSATVGTTTVSAGGAWSFMAATLADGSHTVSATATDSVGNVSVASTAVTFTVDATAPAAPTITAPADGSVTDDGTPTITGTAEDGATVQLTINNATPVSVMTSGGSWTYTPVSNLPTGQTTLSAIAVDGAGNASPASETVRFTYSPVTIITTTLPSGQVGVVYAATVQASGGTSPYVFTVTTGVLPDGVVMSNGGALSGTATASGTFTFTVTATDSNDLSTSQAYSVVVARPADPEVTDVSDVEVTANPGGSGEPTVIDLSGAVQNAIRIEIVTQPDHGVATVNGFEVTYTPQSGYFGQDSFTYRAVGFNDGGAGNAAPAKGGSSASAVSQPATVSIIIAAPTLALTGGTQPAGQIGVAYSQVLTTSGGTAPYSYAVTGGSLPAGISLATDGTLSGSPTAGGTFSFTVTATDSSTGTGPFSVSAVHELTVDAPALAVTPSALPDATTAQAYSQSFSTTGGVAPYSYAVTAGALPTGLTLSPAGVLSGTATQGGVFNFTVSASDSSTGTGPYTAAQPVTLTVAASTIAVAPASLASGTRGTPYTATVAASGGVAPYSYSIVSGALPAGLTLSSTGEISGTSTVVGSFAFQVQATDSATGAGPYSGAVDVTLTIGAASLTVTPTTLPDGLAGVSWSQQLQASGGQGGYSFAVTSGLLPQGLTLTPAGLIGGKPTTAGTFAFTITATDGFGNTGIAALSITIVGRPDPSTDPDVRGLNTAQAEAARRMVGTQLGNFGRRLEQLHRGGESQAGAAMNLTLDGSAFTSLDERRQSMGELGQVLGRDDDNRRDSSGRDELNRMVWGDRTGAAATGGSSRDRSNAGPQTATDGADSSGPRIWAGGAISLGERDATTQTAKMRITTSGISVGVDMSLADNLDLGVGVGFGQENTDVGVDSSRLEADSRVAVAYGSWRPAPDVFIDGILGYGDLGFDTRRRTPVDQSLVFGERDGAAVFGSLSAGLDRTMGPARWIGYGRVDVLNADLDAYVEAGSPLWALSYEARSVESLQGALGLRYERDVLRGADRWTPGVRVEWTHEFGDAGAQGLRYADWLDGPGYSISQEGWERSRFNLGLSLGWRSGDGWSWTGEYDGAFSNGEILNGLRIRGAKAF